MNYFERERARSNGWLAAVNGVSFNEDWPAETRESYAEGADFRLGYHAGLADKPAPFGDLQVRGWREGQRTRNSNKPHSVSRRCP